MRSRAEDAAWDRILDLLLPRPRGIGFANEPQAEKESDSATRQKMRRKLVQRRTG